MVEKIVNCTSYNMLLFIKNNKKNNNKAIKTIYYLKNFDFFLVLPLIIRLTIYN
jgi:hypothetical protein